MKKSKDVMDYSEDNFAIVFAAMGVRTGTHYLLHVSPCSGVLNSKNQALVSYDPLILMSGPAGNEWTEVTVTPSLTSRTVRHS